MQRPSNLTTSTAHRSINRAVYPCDFQRMYGWVAHCARGIGARREVRASGRSSGARRVRRQDPRVFVGEGEAGFTAGFAEFEA
jgi:hypothetical protein